MSPMLLLCFLFAQIVQSQLVPRCGTCRTWPYYGGMTMPLGGYPPLSGYPPAGGYSLAGAGFPINGYPLGRQYLPLGTDPLNELGLVTAPMTSLYNRMYGSTCVDLSPQCALYASTGQCPTNLLIRKLCPISCGTGCDPLQYTGLGSSLPGAYGIGGRSTLSGAYGLGGLGNLGSSYLGLYNGAIGNPLLNNIYTRGLRGVVPGRSIYETGILRSQPKTMDGEKERPPLIPLKPLEGSRRKSLAVFID